MSDEAKVIVNDALVVLCFRDLTDAITAHEFKARAKAKGYDLSKSQCHNMLHRATGRVRINATGKWVLTAMGYEFRKEVRIACRRLLDTV